MTTQIIQETRRSNSNNTIGIFRKIQYDFGLLRKRLITGEGGTHNALLRIDEVGKLASVFEDQTGWRSADSQVVEVGFGPRPERAFAMTAFFGGVTAIDLDMPLLSLADFGAVVRKNGVERALKSACRHILFDARGWEAFHRTLRDTLSGYSPERVQFVIGDAGFEATWSGIGQTHLVFSQDVFEHIPERPLRSLLVEVRKHLAPGGILITIPLIFTGITGGHDLKWYRYRVESNAPGDAWGHLLNPDFKTNTYLNKLTRRDYRRLFEKAGFRVVRDLPLFGRLGEKHLTPEKRAALSAYDDYELFSNKVEFWLVPA